MRTRFARLLAALTVTAIAALGQRGLTPDETESNHALRQALLDCGKLEIDRPALLRSFRGYLDRWPGGTYAPTARELVKELERMIEEDEQHRATSRPLASLSSEQQIAELIFQLRDQNGKQLSQPGEVSALVGDPRSPDDPASRLIAYGYDAVPQLIEAITDTRLTRTVGSVRSFTFSHHVQRVGDAAADIVEFLARTGFRDGPNGQNRTMVERGIQEKAQEHARAWWASVDVVEEVRRLRAAVFENRTGAAEAFFDLSMRYPKDAAATFLEIAEESPEDHRLQPVFWNDAHFPYRGLLRFLATEATSPKTQKRLLAAAEALFRSGNHDALTSLLGRWSAIDAAREDPLIVRSYLRCLLVSRKPDSVHAVTAALRRCSVEVRRETLSLVLSLERHRARVAHFNKTALIPDDPGFRDALESLLVASLDDSDVAGQPFRNLVEPRICDIAAYLLVDGSKEYWGAASRPSTPDERIKAIKEVWRRRQGREGR